MRTVGGIVTAAQALAVVVPNDETLEFEARIANQDIGSIYADQAEQVKVETFQLTRYGTVPAMLRRVSYDAIADEKLGLIYAVDEDDELRGRPRIRTAMPFTTG